MYDQPNPSDDQNPKDQKQKGNYVKRKVMDILQLMQFDQFNPPKCLNQRQLLRIALDSTPDPTSKTDISCQPIK